MKISLQMQCESHPIAVIVCLHSFPKFWQTCLWRVVYAYRYRYYITLSHCYLRCSGKNLPSGGSRSHTQRSRSVWVAHFHCSRHRPERRGADGAGGPPFRPSDPTRGSSTSDQQRFGATATAAVHPAAGAALRVCRLRLYQVLYKPWNIGMLHLLTVFRNPGSRAHWFNRH